MEPTLFSWIAKLELNSSTFLSLFDFSNAPINIICNVNFPKVSPTLFKETIKWSINSVKPALVAMMNF